MIALFFVFVNTVEAKPKFNRRKDAGNWRKNEFWQKKAHLLRLAVDNSSIK